MTGTNETSGIAEELSQLQIGHERFFSIFIREGQVWQFLPLEEALGAVVTLLSTRRLMLKTHVVTHNEVS